MEAGIPFAKIGQLVLKKITLLSPVIHPLLNG